MKLLNIYQNNKAHVALFFTGIFFYFLFVVNPPLYLIKNYREFFTDIYFFRKYFDFPGNPAEYFSRFIIQFYNFPVIASVIITFILYSIYWLGFLALGKSKYSIATSFVPVIILIAMHNDYNHSLKSDIGILFLLTGAFIYFRFFKNKGLLRFFLFPILVCFLYFFTGAIAVFLFSILAMLSELFSKEKKYYSLVILLETIAVTLIFNRYFYIYYSDVFKEIKAVQDIYTVRYLPVLLYISIVAVFIFNALSNLKGFSLTQPAKKVPVIQSKLNFKRLLPILIIPMFTAGIWYTTFNRDEKIKLAVRYFGRNRNWNKVLELSKHSDSFDRAEIIYTNRALYFTGRIYDDLFKYNQDMGSGGLLATKLTSFDEVVPDQEVYLDLGALSMSVVWGTEATNVYGANPFVLKNLTKAYLAMGCTREAQKMLNLLNHTLFNKKWVNQYQKFVNDTLLINADPELSRYKKIRVSEAMVSMTAIENNLYFLTGTSNLNKMAYDYMLISAMLDNNMKTFGMGLSGLKYFGYSHIPKLYFEGFISYSLISEESPVNFEEYTYDQGIVDEFKAFQKDYLRLKWNPEAARKYLFPRYGDTYWFYQKFPRPTADNEDSKTKEKERE